MCVCACGVCVVCVCMWCVCSVGACGVCSVCVCVHDYVCWSSSEWECMNILEDVTSHFAKMVFTCIGSFVHVCTVYLGVHVGCMSLFLLGTEVSLCVCVCVCVCVHPMML